VLFFRAVLKYAVRAAASTAKLFYWNTPIGTIREGCRQNSAGTELAANGCNYLCEENRTPKKSAWREHYALIPGVQCRTFLSAV